MNRRTQRILARVILILLALAITACFAGFLAARAFLDGSEGSYSPPAQNVTEAPLNAKDAGRLPGDDIPATERCYMTEEEIEQARRLYGATMIENVLITHYCSELYPHICGTGDGVTASGRKLEPYVSVAVDPDVIPLGSTVFVDYGDGEIHEYRADDRGAWINGIHIDVAVTYHDEAEQLGRKTATVWFVPGGDE